MPHAHWTEWRGAGENLRLKVNRHYVTSSNEFKIGNISASDLSGEQGLSKKQTRKLQGSGAGGLHFQQLPEDMELAHDFGE